MSHPPDDWHDHDVPRDDGVDLDYEDHHGYDDMLGLGTPDHDESLADDVLEPEPDEGEFRPRRRRRRNPLLVLLALVLAGGLVITAAVYSVNSIGSILPDLSIGGGDGNGVRDYEGPGSGEVIIEIPPGAGGGQIAEILAEADVVATATAFSSTLQADPRAQSISPGTYRMASQMSSQAALARLLDGNFREINGVTIREGLWADEVYALLAEATGHEVEEYEDVDPDDLDLPDAAEGDPEGFLFPSTYEFAPDATPTQQLRAMVDQGKRTYAELGIADDELRDVIVKASIIQGEGMFAEDLPRVARVIENRLDPNPETNGYLQMDSTVHFIYQERGLAGTTDEQRENPDPHNTYYHPGLPSGPINSPGGEAIRAAMNPEPGDWLYFVTVNPHTGETNFAVTWPEHEQNVALFREWCAENEGEC